MAEVDHLGAEPDRHAEPARGGEIPVQDVQWPQKTIEGTERATDDAFEARSRIENRDFAQREDARFAQARPALHALRVAQRFELSFAARQP